MTETNLVSQNHISELKCQYPQSLWTWTAAYAHLLFVLYYVPFSSKSASSLHLPHTHPNGDENGQSDDQPVIHVVVSAPATRQMAKRRRREEKSFSTLLKSPTFYSVTAMQMENNIED